MTVGCTRLDLIILSNWQLPAKDYDPQMCVCRHHLGVCSFQGDNYACRGRRRHAMKRGYTKAWRKEMESQVWLMPPIYHRVWFYLRQKVQHELFLFPTRRLYGVWVLPGQRITSLQEICLGVKWVDNNKEILPDKRTVSRVLEWLEFQQCITVTSNAQGTLICIVNWDSYNVAKPLHVTGDAQGSVPPDVHKKRMVENVDNVNNKETTTAAVEKLEVSDVQNMMSKYIGKLMISGGQIEIIRTMINTYPPERITEAFEAAGAQGDVHSLNWILERLKKKQVDTSEDYDPNKEYPVGSFFHAMQLDARGEL